MKHQPEHPLFIKAIAERTGISENKIAYAIYCIVMIAFVAVAVLWKG